MECVLSGTFNQIESAQKLLQGVFQRRSSVPQQSTGVNETFHYGDTTQTQQNSSDMWDTDHGAIDNFDTKDLSSFEVQPKFMKFLKRVYNKELKDIEETHGVEIVWSENAPQVQISPGRALKSLRNYQKGCDAFIDLYQKCFPNMGREVVELKSADNTGGLIMEAISSVEAENKVIIEMTDNKLLVYAEKSEINGSVQALKEKLGLSQGSNRKTRRSQRSKTREHENPQEGRLSTLKKLLAKAVEFSLHQSDITDERVDAIVNAANDGLQHGGGVAAAIVRKGGRQIEEESRRIMSGRKWRPLNVGDAVYTRGGNLSCRFVIHAVGPRWNARERSRCISLLSRACIESLRLAANLELCSIALPAISSGIFGMPKDTCAQVMFDAVEEFSSSTDAEFSTLRDVRIVIIDDETISFFREEFIRRYTSQETSQTNVTHQERPSSGEQEGSFASNATVEPPSFSPAVEPPEKLSKKSGKHYENSDTSNEGLGPAGESSSNPKEVLNGTKEVHPSNENIPNASKACPPTGIETSNVETEANGTMKQPGLKASAPVKSSEQSNMNITARPSSARGGGRGRGVLAANFPGRGHSEPGFKSSGSTQLYKTGEANSPNAGRGRGITYATSRYSPPGLTVTDEGISLAQNLGKGVKGDHNTSALSMNDKKEAEINEPTNEALKDENQESKQKNQKIDGDKLNAECPRGHTEVKNKSSHSKLDQEDVPGTRLSPDDKITDSQETQKELREESATDGGSKLPTNENKPNEPENETAEPSIQVDQSSSGATNDETTYPKEPLPSNQSGTSQASHSKLDQEDVPGTRLSPDDKITDSQETQKELREESATDGGSKLPTNENKPNEPENETAEPSIQVDRSSSGTTNDETTYPKEPLPSNQSGTSQASHSKLDQEDVPGTRLSPDDKITDSQETQKELCEESATNGGRKLPTNENRPNEPENETAEPSIKVGQSSSGATNEETTYPKEPLPSNQSGTSQAIKEVTPTASYGSVNEHDTVEERRTAENSSAYSGKGKKTFFVIDL